VNQKTWFLLSEVPVLRTDILKKGSKQINKMHFISEQKAKETRLNDAKGVGKF
jgi:hypothetical protein